ncbi:MAG: ankyrin repeat domain-containing protein [Gammaproteobacteria bacterium]
MGLLTEQKYLLGARLRALAPALLGFAVLSALFCSPARADASPDLSPGITPGQQWLRGIETRDPGRLQALFDQGYDQPDLATEKGKTALMVAAQAGDLSLCEALLRAGADVNLSNENGGSPLMHAAVGGNLAIVSLMLARGAAVDSQAVNGWSAITLAAAKGFTPIVETLLSAGANPNLNDIFGWSPLMHAVEQNRAAIVEVFLAQGEVEINVRNNDGVTALHRAAALGYLDIARSLIRAGARTDLQDRTGRTPLDYARQSGNAEIAQELTG